MKRLPRALHPVDIVADNVRDILCKRGRWR
jgi:hypothetical protein